MSNKQQRDNQCKGCKNVNILDFIGNTPLLELKKIAEKSSGSRIFAKAEFLNPSGSVKDRAAKAMILEGIRKGKLTKGKTILDATSGSTGIAYSMIGALLGYPVLLCIPSNVSDERKKMIKAYGTKIIETDPLEGADGAYHKAKELAKKKPEQFFYPDQYNNIANWQAHFDTTAEEIWQQTNHMITHFVAGAGTSGTFVGTTRRLKQYASDVKGILMQPDFPFHGLEGIKHMASTMNPGFFDRNLVDYEIPISTEAAYSMTRRLAKEEGLLVGISSAANVLAALEAAQNAPNGSVIVTVLCDGGYRYLSEPVWEELM